MGWMLGGYAGFLVRKKSNFFAIFLNLESKMSDGVVVETIFGKHHKYQVIKKPGTLFSSITYVIYRDGKYYKGTYDSLARAVEVAKKEG